MKQTYVKPMGQNVQYAVNENIASSYSFMGFELNLVQNGTGCNAYISDATAGYATGFESGVNGDGNALRDFWGVAKLEEFMKWIAYTEQGSNCLVK